MPKTRQKPDNKAAQLAETRLRISGKFLFFIRFLPVIFCSLAINAQAQNPPQNFSFALLGDMPYGVDAGQNSPAMNTLVKQINRDTAIEWVLHVGDIKTGLSRCSDALFEDRKNRFAEFHAPFVLTPGDNEWTDCHRLTAGRFDPLERLEKLRRVFFSETEPDLTQTVDWLKIQAKTNAEFAEFSENRMWKKDEVLFATIHMVSSQQNSEHEQNRRREQAALLWLDTLFSSAHKEKAKAIFIAAHVNPGFNNSPVYPCSACKLFVRSLFKLSEAFPGQVVLAHGDSHTFRIDQPRFGKLKAPANFLRVETFGDSNKDWIKVSIDTSGEGIFSFTPVLNRDN